MTSRPVSYHAQFAARGSTSVSSPGSTDSGRRRALLGWMAAFEWSITQAQFAAGLNYLVRSFPARCNQRIPPNTSSPKCT